MKVIYTSGPFSDVDNIHGIEAKIIEASKWSLLLWALGFAVICPHKNTKDYQHEKTIHYDTWINGDLEILRRCDAIFMLPGWEGSKGACKELAEAKRIGIEVYFFDDEHLPTP